MSRLLSAVLAVLVAVPALAQTSKSALDKQTMEAYVRHLFVWGPQIQVKIDDAKPSPLPGFFEVKVTGMAGGAVQEEVFHVSKDGQKIVRGVIFDVSRSPFAEELAKLKTDGAPRLGPEAAPVSIVVFSDFQCGYCREEAKVLRENVAATFPNDVRIYFKDFPLQQIHPWAKPAAMAGRCVYGQSPEAFWQYHDWIFENQSAMTAENVKSKVMEFARDKDLDVLLLGNCIDRKATEPEVNQSLAEGFGLRVNSTPTLFINGRRIPGQIAWPNLKSVIEHELQHQKSAAESKEKCCEVSLPTPLDQ